MKITNEIRLKIFAQYIGQDVLHKGETVKLDGVYYFFARTTDINKKDEEVFTSDCKLLLTPLSEITDEDAIGLCEIIGSFTADNFINGLVKGNYSINSIKALSACQFLQSKGYDLPHYLLGGKTLIESGLAISK